MNLAIITIHKGNSNNLKKTISSIIPFLKQPEISGYLIYESGGKSLISEDINHEKILYKFDQETLGITYALNASQFIAESEFKDSTHHCYIHSGDIFSPDMESINNLSKLTSRKEIIDFIFWSHYFKDKVNHELIKSDFKLIRTGMTVAHIGSIISHSIHQKIGGYSMKYKLAMDYNFFLKAYFAKATFKEYKSVFVTIDGCGSISCSNPYKSNAEVSKALFKNLPNNIFKKIYFSTFLYLKLNIRRFVYEILENKPRLRKYLRKKFNKRIINL